MPRLAHVLAAILLFSAPGLSHASETHGVRRLTGPEVAALKVAVDDIRAHRFAKIGDLKHYDVEVARHGGTLEVSFFPHQKKYFAPGEAGTGGGTVYGDEVHIFVSLKRLKVLRYQFAR
jgi:hypothetical protein